MKRQEKKSASRFRGLIFFIFFFSALLSASIYFCWGFINPGHNFAVFYDKEIPGSFDAAFNFVKETQFDDRNGLIKWTDNLRMAYEGAPTDRDVEALHKIADAYNSVRGFPGLEIVQAGSANVKVIFPTRENFKTIKESMGVTGSERSFCRLHYSDGGVIGPDAHILIEPGGAQGYRNSVILHEAFHLVGFTGHTANRKSILNKFSPVPGLCAADILAMKMIYNPDIRVNTTFEKLKGYYDAIDINEFLDL